MIEEKIKKLKNNIIELSFDRIMNSYAFVCLKKLKSIKFIHNKNNYMIIVIKRRIYLFEFENDNNIGHKLFDMKLNENNYYIICNYCKQLLKEKQNEQNWTRKRN